MRYSVAWCQVEVVLKGVVRAERLSSPADVVPTILERVKPEYIQRRYNLQQWEDATDFLTQLAKHSGKLLKGGEPDINHVSVQVINDWQRVSRR